MKVHGLPKAFWIVTSPTANSERCDICFECDFHRFALYIRGGLDEQKIVGIFADQANALELAEKLLQANRWRTVETDIRFHKSPWLDWYATQDSDTSMTIYCRTTGAEMVVESPQEWGSKWSWNISADGSGIVMRRTP